MTENATSTDKNTPATSLTDKERELIAQMPYEEARPSTSRASRQRSHRRHAVQPRLSCLPARHPAARTRVRTGLSSASRHTIVVIRPHWQQFIEGKSHVNVDSCIPSAS